jgi:hypothetical protein
MVRTGEQCEGTSPCVAPQLDEDPLPADPGTMDLVYGKAKAGGSEADAAATRMLELATVARAHTAWGPAATLRSDDLDVNLLVFREGNGVAEHANAEVDVLLVGIAGEGVVTIDGRTHSL